MSGVPAHIELPSLLPPPLLVLLAVAAVLAPTRLDRRGSDTERRPVAAFLADRSAATGLVLLVAVGAVVWATAVAPRPGPVLAWAWLALTAASVLFGRVWQAGNPVRLLVRAINRLIDPDDAGAWAPPRHAPGVVAAAGLFVLGWLQHAPLPSAAVAAALGGYLAAHLLAGLAWGPGWLSRADTVEVYGTLVADVARGGVRDPAPLAVGSPAGLAVLAGLVAVPLHVRLARQPVWLDLTEGLTARLGDLAAAGLLVLVGLVAFAALRSCARGDSAVAFAPAAIAVFASHQAALLLRPPVAVQAEMTSTDPRLLAATVLPLLVLLAGIAHASYRLQRRTRGLPVRQARGIRVPGQVLLGALAVVTALLWATPL